MEPEVKEKIILMGKRLEVTPLFEEVTEDSEEGLFKTEVKGTKKFTGEYLVIGTGVEYLGLVRKYDKVVLPKVYQDEDDFEEGATYVIVESVIDKLIYNENRENELELRRGTLKN